jgi:hypothetical protein
MREPIACVKFMRTDSAMGTDGSIRDGLKYWSMLYCLPIQSYHMNPMERAELVFSN